MSKKLYVGNLSWNTSEEALERAFAQFDNIEEVKVITDRDTGRSRGFGFITFSDANSAMEAMQAMDQKEIDGRRVTVKEAIDKPRSGGPRRDRY